MDAEVLSTETPALFDAAAARAADLLRHGHVVALPTETVYGLAANAWNAAAVRRIFQVKGRPARNPVIVHVADLALARRCVAAWPPAADALARAFWPGPLTFVLPRAPEIPDAVTGGGPTVGVRWPSHPFIQAVIRACGFPLAAPSANRSNEISPTNAAHVRQTLGRLVPLIVDGGQAQVGIESTVIDLSVAPARILRPGMVHAPALAAVLGTELDARALAPGPGPLTSPGQLPKHYAPSARLIIREWRDEADLAAQAAALNAPRHKIHIIAHTRIPLRETFGRVAVMPHDAEAYARALYAELHQCDAAGAAVIIAEAPPPSPEWRAIADRLSRASS